MATPLQSKAEGNVSGFFRYPSTAGSDFEVDIVEVFWLCWIAASVTISDNMAGKKVLESLRKW